MDLPFDVLDGGLIFEDDVQPGLEVFVVVFEVVKQIFVACSDFGSSTDQQMDYILCFDNQK